MILSSARCLGLTIWRQKTENFQKNVYHCNTSWLDDRSDINKYLACHYFE